MPDIFEARAEAGGLHASLAVPTYLEAFMPYSRSEASNGSSHGLHGVFYGGFLLTAAAEQYGFPPPPGTTETLYPQGPTEGAAEVVPNDFSAFGESSGRSGVDGASGSSAFGGGEFPGFGRAGFGETKSAVVATANKVTSTASVLMNDLTFSDVMHIGSVAGEASASATGSSGGAASTGRLALNDVTVLGVPVTLFDEPLPGVPPLDAALAQAGITVARLPDVRTADADGTAAHMQIGGVMITFDRPEREFKATVVLGRLDVAARAQSVSPLPTAPAVGGATESFFDEYLSGGGGDGGALSPAPALPGEAAAGIRSVRRVDVAPGPDFSVLAAVVALASIGALFSRRILYALTH